MLKRLLLFLLLLAGLGVALAQDPGPVRFGGLQVPSASPVALPAKSLPSWLSASWTPIYNGINQYAAVNPMTRITGNWSAMWWVKPYRIDTGRMWSARGSGIGCEVLFNTSGSILAWSDAESTTRAFLTPSVVVGVWKHLALTKNNTEWKFYIDGVLASTTTVPASAGIDTLMHIGKFNGGTAASHYADAALAELCFWGVTLSPSDIQRYYTKRLKGTETGLVNLWHMDEGPLGQTMVDVVGSKNGIATNSVAWSRRSGYGASDIRSYSNRFCLSFDGVDDYVSAASMACQIAPLSSFTMSVWFQPRAGSDDGMVGRGAAGSSGLSMGLYSSFGATHRGVYAFSITAANIIPSYIVDTYAKWQHAVVTRPAGAGATGSIYLNGVLISSNTADVSSGQASGTGPLFIGVAPNGVAPYVSTYYNGKLCEVSIWNRYFTADEIKAQYFTNLTGSEPYLNSYFPLNEGTGTTVDNKVAGGPDGSFGGAPTWVGRDIP
jgi:hypothetical protein